MAETAQSSAPGAAPPNARELKKARKEARLYVKETRRLVQRHQKRLGKDKAQQLEEAAAGVEAALRSDAEALARAVERLEAAADKHLAFARRNPSVEYGLSVGKALLLALALRLFVVEAFKIPSGSMIPTLLIGDHLFVNKLSYGVRLPAVNWLPLHWGGYDRGDVVVFVTPLDDALPLLDRRDYIKRIIGLPGDTIEVKDEVLLVNGVAQPRELVQPAFPYYERIGDGGPWVHETGELFEETLTDPKERKVAHAVMRAPDRAHLSYEGPFKVPEGHLFMMGDNRDNSADGRSVPGGWYVPFDHVKGRALFIWLSLGKPGLWFWGDSGIRFDRFFDWVH